MNIHPPSSKKIDPLETDLLLTAETLLKEVHQICITSHSFINRFSELKKLGSNELNAYFSKFGSRFIKYLVFDRKRERAVAACAQAAKILKGKLQYALSATKLAILKFGVGECDETATAVALKISRVAPSYFILIGQKDFDQTNFEFSYGHCFALGGVNAKNFEKLRNKHNSAFKKIIEELGEGIIIDPFLNFTCRTDELSTKGKDLLEYAKAWDLTTIIEAGFCNPEGCPKEELINKETQAVYDLALKIFPKITLPERAFFDDFIAQKMSTAIQKQFAFCKWKCRMKEGSLILWAEESKEIIDQLKEQLQSRGIFFESAAVKGKNTFAIIIKDPDPTILMDGQKEKLPSPTEAKKD